MNPSNLEALRRLLRETLLCLAEEGTVTDHTSSRLMWIPTFETRIAMSALEQELQEADSFDAIGAIAMQTRALSVTQNFYPPRARVNCYERLVMIKVLTEQGMLVHTEWWRFKPLLRT